MATKSELRKEMRALRSRLTQADIESASMKIWKQIDMLPEYHDKNIIFSYVNYNQEVITDSYLIDYIKTGRFDVYVPKIYGKRDMRFHRITDWAEQITEGAYGIPEPSNSICIDEKSIIQDSTVIILPGLCFDMQCNRIGYGGGYYDTFLVKHPQMLKIAVAYDFQITDCIDTVEDTDIRADIIVTDKRIIKR